MTFKTKKGYLVLQRLELVPHSVHLLVVARLGLAELVSPRSLRTLQPRVQSGHFSLQLRILGRQVTLHFRHLFVVVVVLAGFFQLKEKYEAVTIHP